MARLRNPHPGEILKEEFLDEIGLSQNQLAQAIGVPGNRIHAIVNGTRDITGDTDLRLCKFFGLSDGYFLRLQNAYDMLEAKRRIAAQLAKIKPYQTTVKTKNFRNLVRQTVKRDPKFAEALLREGIDPKETAVATNGRVGSSFDHFLKEEGIHEEVTARAIARVRAEQGRPVRRKRQTKQS
jgi:addiction module HigA family antidote